MIRLTMLLFIGVLLAIDSCLLMNAVFLNVWYVLNFKSPPIRLMGRWNGTLVKIQSNGYLLNDKFIS